LGGGHLLEPTCKLPRSLWRIYEKAPSKRLKASIALLLEERSKIIVLYNIVQYRNDLDQIIDRTQHESKSKFCEVNLALIEESHQMILLQNMREEGSMSNECILATYDTSTIVIVT